MFNPIAQSCIKKSNLFNQNLYEPVPVLKQSVESISGRKQISSKDSQNLSQKQCNKFNKMVRPQEENRYYAINYQSNLRKKTAVPFVLLLTPMHKTENTRPEY